MPQQICGMQRHTLVWCQPFRRDLLLPISNLSQNTLVASLNECFCPDINRERYYCEFEDATLRPSEDPTLFLLRLKESFRNACYTKMEAMVSSLSESHAQLIAAVTPQHQTKSRAQAENQLPASIECFRCHQLGHITRNCTFPPIHRRPQPSPDAQIQCIHKFNTNSSLCFGWGHIGRNCADKKGL